jgi:ATP-grasp domain-containing protein
MKTILVTGAGGSAAHNFVESLRVAPYKYRIIGTDINPYHIHLTAVDERYILPESSSPDYLKCLEEVIEAEAVDFVHPQPDSEVLRIAGAKLGALTLLPSKEVILRCQQKMEAQKALEKHGVPVPLTEPFTEDYQMKSSKMWLRANHGAGSKAALPITTAEQGHAWVAYWRATKGMDYEDFMVSEYLPGADYAWTSLWKDGELMVSQGRKRIWYLYGFLSPSGTSSTPSLAVTVNNPKVNEVATDAVKAIDPKPNGVYCVDLKENLFKVPCVTEVNAGRFFTTSNFYTHAGVNFPFAYLQLAFGFEMPHYERYDSLPAGLYWVRMVDMHYRLMTEKELNDVKRVPSPALYAL